MPFYRGRDPTFNRPSEPPRKTRTGNNLLKMHTYFDEVWVEKRKRRRYGLSNPPLNGPPGPDDLIEEELQPRDFSIYTGPITLQYDPSPSALPCQVLLSFTPEVTGDDRDTFLNETDKINVTITLNSGDVLEFNDIVVGQTFNYETFETESYWQGADITSITAAPFPDLSYAIEPIPALSPTVLLADFENNELFKSEPGEYYRTTFKFTVRQLDQLQQSLIVAGIPSQFPLDVQFTVVDPWQQTLGPLPLYNQRGFTRDFFPSGDQIRLRLFHNKTPGPSDTEPYTYTPEPTLNDYNRYYTTRNTLPGPDANFTVTLDVEDACGKVVSVTKTFPFVVEPKSYDILLDDFVVRYDPAPDSCCCKRLIDFSLAASAPGYNDTDIQLTLGQTFGNSLTLPDLYLAGQFANNQQNKIFYTDVPLDFTDSSGISLDQPTNLRAVEIDIVNPQSSATVTAAAVPRPAISSNIVVTHTLDQPIPSIAVPGSDGFFSFTTDIAAGLVEYDLASQLPLRFRTRITDPWGTQLPTSEVLNVLGNTEHTPQNAPVRVKLSYVYSGNPADNSTPYTLVADNSWQATREGYPPGGDFSVDFLVNDACGHLNTGTTVVPVVSPSPPVVTGFDLNFTRSANNNDTLFTYAITAFDADDDVVSYRFVVVTAPIDAQIPINGLENTTQPTGSGSRNFNDLPYGFYQIGVIATDATGLDSPQFDTIVEYEPPPRDVVLNVQYTYPDNVSNPNGNNIIHTATITATISGGDPENPWWLSEVAEWSWQPTSPGQVGSQWDVNVTQNPWPTTADFGNSGVVTFTRSDQVVQANQTYILNLTVLDISSQDRFDPIDQAPVFSPATPVNVSWRTNTYVSTVNGLDGASLDPTLHAIFNNTRAATDAEQNTFSQRFIWEDQNNNPYTIAVANIQAGAPSGLPRVDVERIKFDGSTTVSTHATLVRLVRAWNITGVHRCRHVVSDGGGNVTEAIWIVDFANMPAPP